jgi:hypothetical protein
MCRVFISYRRSGTLQIARLVKSQLLQIPGLRSEDVFLDESDIETGRDFDSEIWKSLSTAELFVVLIDSEVVERERRIRATPTGERRRLLSP